MKRFLFVPYIFMLLLVSSCDDFALYKHYSRERIVEEVIIDGGNDPIGAELFFSVQSTEIISGDQKLVTIHCGKPPYKLYETERDVYSSGTGSSDLGIFSEEMYTAGKSCGEIELSVLDFEGTQRSINIFVRPKPIENLVITRENGNAPKLTWTYPSDLVGYIESFEIQRQKQNETSFILLTTVSSGSSLSYTDATDPNLVRYRVRSIAGDVRSPFVEGQTP